MNDKDIMRRYYEHELKKIKAIDPLPAIPETTPARLPRPIRFCWEDVFGCLVTAGYLFLFLIPERWFSFGNFLFSFRLSSLLF